MKINDQYGFFDIEIKKFSKVKLGDIITYHNENHKITYGIIIRFDKNIFGDSIKCKRIRTNSLMFEIGDMSGIPYIEKEIVCECGAKYTSNPTFHLDYCKIK